VHTTWGGLDQSLVEDPSDACLVDADHPDRDRASSRILTLRKDHPELAIIAYLESDRAAGYFDLGSLGVDGVVVGSGRASGVRAEVDAALSTARAAHVTRLLEDRVPAPGPAAIAWAMVHAGPTTSVDRLASGLGYTRRGLRHALQSAGLPAPSRVLLWGRLILAGARLAENERTVEDVAFSLGYATSFSLARAMKVHTDLTPAGIARNGNMTTVLDRLFPPEAAPRRGRKGACGALGKLASLLVALSLVGCATAGAGLPGVEREGLALALESPPLDQMHVGVYAVDARTGRPLVAHNEGRRFVPASNQKIPVAAAALSLLGPDYRFTTAVVAHGRREGSRLDGDLVLQGSGDPSLSSRYWESGTAALQALADSVRASGVAHVTGSLVVDVSAWDSTSVAPTREVEDLRYAYGSTGGAFAIDEGEVRVVVRGGAHPGEPVQTTWAPVGTTDFVESRIVTSEPDAIERVRSSYLPESRRLVLHGHVAPHSVDTVSFALRDPVRQAALVFRNALVRAGIEVEGGLAIRWTRDDERSGNPCRPVHPRACGRRTQVGALVSPPLIELVGDVFGPSQNWMAEQLLLALGERFGAEGSWAAGIVVLESFLVDDIGVDPRDMSVRDGSGLSAYNLLTPRVVVQVLQAMDERPWGPAFRASLPGPGTPDSTMEERLLDLCGRLQAKTGTISNVNSLSGYLVRNSGQEVIFSILANGSGLPASRVEVELDEVVRRLAR